MIVISGITSGLGISLAKRLASQGYFVKGFSRNGMKVKELLSHPSIEILSGDLNDENFVNSICKDAFGVVHLAALSSPWGKYSDFYTTNVIGTQCLIRASQTNKVERFIHISTPSLYFDYNHKLNIDEADLPTSSVNDYALTKRMAERVVDKAYEEGLDCITLRPRAIFGPHDQTLFPRVLKACVRDGLPCFTKTSPLVDITYVDNVSHAIELSLKASKNALGKKYNITNDEPLFLWEILEHLLSKLDITFKKRKIPYSLAYCAAYLSEFKSRLTGIEPLLTRYGVGVMSYSQTLSINKAKKELNYKPILTINEGVQRYVEWLQA